MAGQLPQSYYNPTGASQAQLQSTYGAGYNQPGTAANTAFMTPTTTNTSSASNPYYVNYSAGYTPSSYADVNPYIADYSNLGINNNTSIWDQYNTATTGTIANTTSSSSNLPGRVYQTQIPISGDISSWAEPSWLSDALGYQYYENSGNPYLTAYSTSPLDSGSMWNYINTLGYDPETFLAMQQNAMSQRGYTPTTYQSLLNQATQSNLGSYEDTIASLNSLIDQLSQPVEVPEVDMSQYETEDNLGKSMWQPFSWNNMAPLASMLYSDEQLKALSGS